MKILFAVQQLGIGGAETHIIGLSKTLSRLGHNITVVSAGGVLTEELKNAGIPHVRLPLNRKNPFSVFRALWGLKKLIRNEKYDIVHAHARIPAFLCHILHRRHPFRFVTTAHLDFAPRPFRNLTFWGEKTLAVSEDIKDYLIREYTLFPDNISVTVNGIDTEVFVPSPSEGNPCSVVHISRFDPDRSLSAFCLMDAVDALKPHYPDLTLTLVGDGRDMPRLKQKADRLNRKYHSQTVCLTGGKTDVLPYLHAAGIFVGVSRAALEAMSCGLPVILSGNQGYLGIYSSSLFTEAASGNFCCRGNPLPHPARLCHDLEELIRMSPEERKKLGEEGRKTVCAHYTFTQTAEDYLSLYAALPPLPGHGKRYLLCGYFGFGNMGDEAILASEIQAIRVKDPSATLTVLSHAPDRTAAAYGVKAIHRYSPFGVLFATAKCNCLIFGGGGVLQDRTSLRSLGYYLFLLQLAVLFRKKFFITANGIGPLDRTVSRKAVCRILRHAAEITVRDRESAALLRKIGLDTQIRVVPDPAGKISPAPASRIQYLRNRLGLNRQYFVLSLRPIEGNDHGFFHSVLSACRMLCLEADRRVLILLMHPSTDRRICRRAADLLPDSVIAEALSPSETVGLIAEADFLAGMRLHSLVFAKSVGTPFFAFSYDPKVRAFAMENGAMGSSEIDGTAGEKWLDAVHKQ